MAIHDSVQSMLKESLVEMLLVAKYCIDYRKDENLWGTYGCYGYPAAILLFSITDSIGSYVLGGTVRQHFEILNHKDYYDFDLDKNILDLIYEKYRCFLTHNAVTGSDVALSLGTTGKFYEFKEGMPYINLVPFLDSTKRAVIKFLGDSDEIVPRSEKLKEILSKLNSKYI